MISPFFLPENHDSRIIILIHTQLHPPNEIQRRIEVSGLFLLLNAEVTPKGSGAVASFSNLKTP